MAIWYEGNRNNPQNKREKNGVTYYVRGLIEVESERFERYGVKTHFIERGENFVDIVRQYVLPIYEKGDIVAVGEKVVSMCQNNTVDMKNVKLGFFARFMSKFATKNHNGIGMNEPYKLQLAINMKGLPLVLWATFCGAVAKLFGKKGVFYKIVGQDVAGIDGFYSHSAFDIYHKIAVLNPKEPDKVCDTVFQELGISCIIADANDISVEILAKSNDLANKEDAYLAKLIKDNPAGQDDELTPFIIIREIGDKDAEPYVPLTAIEGPID